MMTGDVRTEHELQMLETLVDGAFQHAKRFNALALAETDTATMLQVFDAFHRASQAVRLGIRLGMALRAPLRPAAAPVARDDEARPEPAEPAEAGTPGVETERDRETERVSLPRFLAAIGHVADDVDRLAPEAGAAQPGASLRDVLAHAKALAAEPPATAPLNVLSRPPSQRTPQLATTAPSRPDSS